MRVLAISIIILVCGISLFGQDIQVKVKVDDFTGDTIRYTKRWQKIAGNGFSRYIKAKGKNYNKEIFLSLAICTSANDLFIDAGNNILFKMSNGEIVPITIINKEFITMSSLKAKEFIIDVGIDFNIFKILISELNVEAIRVITNGGAYNYTVDSEDGETIKNILVAIDK